MMAVDFILFDDIPRCERWKRRNRGRSWIYNSNAGPHVMSILPEIPHNLLIHTRTPINTLELWSLSDVSVASCRELSAHGNHLHFVEVPNTAAGIDIGL